MANNEKYYQSRSPLGGFIPLVMMGVVFIVLYFLAKSVFWILSWMAIPLIILALILDYSVVVDYGKYILKLLGEKPLYGIGLAVFTVIGYPFVSAFLAGRAFMNKKVKEFTGGGEAEKKETFTKYEEVEEDESFLDLEPLKKKEPEVLKQTRQPGNEYDDLFE